MQNLWLTQECTSPAMALRLSLLKDGRDREPETPWSLLSLSHLARKPQTNC